MTDATIHSCGRERVALPVSARGKHLVIDIHCHLAVNAAEQQIRDAIPGFTFQMPFSSPASGAVTGKLFTKIGPTLSGVEQRLIDMGRFGIDLQAISPSPGQYFYFTDPDLGRDLARTVNDGVAEAVARHPDRLIGMGTVPLQAPELAIAEMRRCVNELGMRGIEINSNVNGTELAAAVLRPFFAAAEELGILLFLHPLGFTHGQRLSEHYLTNIIGNPLESTIALSHLIFGGVLDQFQGLKLCVAPRGAIWVAIGGAWTMPIVPEMTAACTYRASPPPICATYGSTR